MNKREYNLDDLQGRVEAMEEDCADAIATDKVLPMAACVIPEARWLLDSINSLQSGLSPKEASTKAPKIDGRVRELERRYGSAIVAGKFVKISASFITDLRTLLGETERLQALYAKRRQAAEAALSAPAV